MIGKLLGPAVDAVLYRLESRVSVEDHLRSARRAMADARRATPGDTLAGRVLADLDRQLEADLTGVAPSAVDWPEAEAQEALASGDATAADWIALGSRRTVGAADLPGPPEALEPSASDAANAGRTAILDASLVAGTAPDALAALLEAHAAALEPRLWYRKVGVRYGNAHLLRALVRVAGWQAVPGARAITQELCDRLMRHAEVRRENSLAFNAGALPPGADPLAERLRYALVLVEASHAFADLRYLNSALKLFDCYQGEVDRGSDLARVCYAVGIGAQERAMRELLGG